MRIVHFSDLHLGMENYAINDPKTGVSSRFLDFLNSLDFIVDFCLKPENKIDLVLFGGDAYKTRDPSPTYTNAFAQRIKKIANHLPVVLLVGNHDLPSFLGKCHTLEIFPALDVPNVFVKNKPEVQKIKTKHGVIQVATLPWVNKVNLIGNMPKATIEESNSLITQKLGQTIERLNAQIDKKMPAVLLAHYSVIGATYGSEQSVMIGRDMAIALKDIKRTNFDYVGLGHLHKYQVLSKNPLTIYSGSIEKVDFGESKDKKGFILLDVEEKREKTKFQFIETPAREFITIDIKLPRQIDPTHYILRAIKKYKIKDTIVRINISGYQDVVEKIEQSKITEALKGAHFIAGINLDIVDMLKKQNIILATKEMGWYDLLQNYLKNKKIAKTRSDKIIEEAQKLVAEIQGEP